jgi:hypothetical protein
MMKAAMIKAGLVGLVCAVALVTTACSQTASSGGAAGAGVPKGNFPWDWTGIIGTGQSLSVGQKAQQVVTKEQPYHNMRLSTGNLPWPIDPNNAELKLVPLTEPAGRLARSFPSAWPTNLDGETPHTAMSIELTAMVEKQFKHDYVTIHSVVGEDGQGIRYLKKNPDRDPRNINGHSYEAALIETKAIARLAKEAGKTFGVGAITVHHGESDAGNAQYERALYQLWQDYNTDLPAITGQKTKILMITSQHNSTNNSASTQAQWKIGVDYPEDIVCSGPKYQFESPDALHLNAEGYRQVGEKSAQIYYQRVILGQEWQPLYPTKVDRDGATVTVHFHVPVGPLVWDTNLDTPHSTIAEWKNGKGFEVRSGNTRVAIHAVDIKGDAVVITCERDPGAGAHVSYAMIGERAMTKPFRGFARWGLLKDSDPFKGSVTGKEQANWCVAFDMTAP